MQAGSSAHTHTMGERGWQRTVLALKKRAHMLYSMCGRIKATCCVLISLFRLRVCCRCLPIVILFSPFLCVSQLRFGSVVNSMLRPHLSHPSGESCSRYPLIRLGTAVVVLVCWYKLANLLYYIRFSGFCSLFRECHELWK